MASDMTPRDWPARQRGLLDDLWEALREAAPVRRLRRGLEAATGGRPGRMSVALPGGQSALLTGGQAVRVDCLRGRARVSCPARGRDAVLTPGQSLCLEAGGGVSVTALDSPAELSFGWS